MKIICSIAFVFSASAAFAHEALAPHQHPHPISMLPDLHTFIAAAIAIAVVAIDDVKFGRNS